MPQGKAQQPEAQSATLRHWPPMNCWARPLPTFFSPAGSNWGPPTQARASPLLSSDPPGPGLWSHPARLEAAISPPSTSPAGNLFENSATLARLDIIEPLPERGPGTLVNSGVGDSDG